MHRKRLSGTTKPSLLHEYMEKYGNAGIRRRTDLALRTAKIEAELAFRARGTFLESMNHELRTPLNAIFGFGSMLKDAQAYDLNTGKAKEYVGHILTSAELLLAHIDTLLELAAVESGGAKMVLRQCNIAELLSDIVEEGRQGDAARGIEFVVSIDENVPHPKVDPAKIQSAFTHILTGAISQCREGDKISIVCKTGKEANGAVWVYTAVSDTGAGMSPEELDRAMRMFDHTPQWLNRQIDGLGLGLPIARSFTEINRGKFSIHSKKGKGTTVRMAFPACVEDDAGTSPGENGHKTTGMDIRQAG